MSDAPAEPKWRALASLAAALVLTSCSEIPDKGLACFPAAAQRWIAATADTGPTDSREVPISIYVDGSASMAGFINGGTRDEKLLADLVTILPNAEIAGTAPVAVMMFDQRSPYPLAPGAVAGLQQAGAYLDKPGTAERFHQESHIDQALGAIARAKPNSLSIIVTDLWLDNKKLGTTDEVAMGEQLFAILASGRSIAIWGFDSPYAGRVEGLPSGSRDVAVPRHHLFVLAAGPQARLESLRKSFTTASSGAISRQAGTANPHYSLFTLDPTIRLAADRQPFQLGTGGSLTKASGVVKIRNGVVIQELALAAGKARQQVGGTAEAPAEWQWKAGATIAPGTVWAGPVTGSVAIYRGNADTCDSDWRPYGTLQGSWQDGAQPGFALEPAKASSQLAEGVNLLVGEVRRTALSSPNTATKWMRDWSFNAESEASAVRQPVMPVLNLAETARTLEAALARAAEKKPVIVGGFVVAIRKDS